MKFIANFFVTALFVPIFLLVVFFGSIKYQLLDYRFWQSKLTHPVYTDMSKNIAKVVEIDSSRSKTVDPVLKVFSKLATPENLQDFIEKNLLSFLMFANAEKSEWQIYFPITKVPKGVLNINGVKIQEYVTASKLIQDFKINGISEKHLSKISKSGDLSVKYFVYGIFLLVVLLLISMLLVEAGARFIATGFLFILSGLTLYLLLIPVNVFIGSIKTEWVVSNEPLQLMLVPVLPQVLQSLTTTWTYVAILAVILGIVVSFLKKPQIKV